MPALDQITLSPQDLLNIVDELKNMHHNAPVVIIDTLGSLTIRDTSQQFLTEIKREDPEPDNP